MNWRLPLLLACSLLLVGCNTLSPSLKQTKKAALIGPELPQHWVLAGRIGVLKGGEGWHGKMDWRQDKTDFTIRILGPFGGEQAELRHRNDKLELRGSNGKSVSGPRLAAWERDTFGTSLPVNALPYWLHGHPFPGEQASPQRDAKGQLKELRQLGWRVIYSDWGQRGGRPMPGKLSLERNQVRIKLIINEYNRRG
ncbi:MAG: lipoprotein insertase outer membrane protein LolB [Gammaproteobacteria bacterium SHHR-1]|uniref:lipoprotein insertase outer membrane protein LolB n=1 Tax=Magnetovirga frankeli TaxID=947516 RepID=UPI00129387B8|nr:outer membrane lipoprotein LolB [gamma proteobacterium SS-5]